MSLETEDPRARARQSRAERAARREQRKISAVEARVREQCRAQLYERWDLYSTSKATGKFIVVDEPGAEPRVCDRYEDVGPCAAYWVRVGMGEPFVMNLTGHAAYDMIAVNVSHAPDDGNVWCGDTLDERMLLDGVPRPGPEVGSRFFRLRGGGTAVKEEGTVKTRYVPELGDVYSFADRPGEWFTAPHAAVLVGDVQTFVDVVTPEWARVCSWVLQPSGDRTPGEFLVDTIRRSQRLTDSDKLSALRALGVAEEVHH